ncbi:EscC/YscC/HrcC family type III secretion system outer membrane ring protein [Candidatus Arsenophonus nilaparvatae]|uniref:EscC/YscC/HrcC family type III secretion system outer membrane ring protein n=1 Tax=Candidatus Arsenophonus nilaparvatae TaxID=1247023 RepID=UPI0005097079|nr:EscC/YscC/HrcC family type III secretion system outer membrane ring protein [Candidatus Arsenophonus nilaparvatae]
MKNKLCCLFLLTTTVAQAASISSIHWQDSDPFVYVSRGTPLASVIRDIGNSYGIPMDISAQIQDTFSGRIENKTPQEILAFLAHQYGLVWYYDGDVLHAYKAQEMNNQIVSLSALSSERALNYMGKAGFLDKNSCEVKSINGLNALQVYGVPDCINKVTRFINQVDQEAKQNIQTQRLIRIFPLKYASATDTIYQYRKQNVTVPGIVSVLKQMNQTNASGVNAQQDITSFAADPRQNAVVVSSNKHDMGLYSTLIKQLDIAPTMIEVSVSIIDVDASDFNQLGIDWSANAKIGGGSISFNQGTSGSDNFSTVIGNTGNFMVRLNALEKTSKAKILSRPSVVTLNNVQAVLDKNITFYTKLQGDKVAKLESVTAGSLLRVTPRLIDSNGRKKVMLSLNIEDGQQAKAINDSEPLPQVQNSEIATQATLNTGESLLLGGFVQDKDQTVQNKIPLLGDLPLIGGLFRSEDRSKQSVIRLFLIKAEPINQGG